MAYWSRASYFCCRYLSSCSLLTVTGRRNASRSLAPILSACKRSINIRLVHLNSKLNGNTSAANANNDTLADVLPRNVFLMGSPGCGKTTLALVVAEHLEMSAVDIDDDFLENHWGMTVATKLAEVGGDQFVTDEGAALLTFEANNSVVALTGSNPLHEESMKHVQSLGIIVFIDVPITDVLERLHRMKVDRIVSPRPGMAMADVLQYRQQFYERWYDLRVLCHRGESVDSIADKIVRAVTRFSGRSEYVSTRGGHDARRSWSEALLAGLAGDGGLFVPDEYFPALSDKQLHRLVGLDYAERALRLLELVIHPWDAPSSTIRRFLRAAYDEGAFGGGPATRVVTLGERKNAEYVHELFHGPTGSFKDLSLRMFPYFFHRAAETCSASGERRLILVATSGDTGSAVAHGFSSIPSDAMGGRVKVLVLYPEEGVSQLQKLQLLSSRSPSVSVVGVASDFDFCQSAIKKLLGDESLSRELQEKYKTTLSVANSINWARLVLQTVHHVSGYLDMVKQDFVYMGQQIDIAVPTGNFGNILSALYAGTMGVPIRKLICASNSNNVLSELINTGRYHARGRHLVRTISPAIDILHSSNLERFLFDAMSRNGEKLAELYRDLDENGRFIVPSRAYDLMKRTFLAGWCSEDRCFSTIQETFEKSGYLLDPHTAVAKAVANGFRVNRAGVPLLICATAHYAKSASDVLNAVCQTDVGGMCPAEQLERLERLNACPAMHKGLKTVAMLQPAGAPHSVLQPSVEDIVSHINDFLSK